MAKQTDLYVARRMSLLKTLAQASKTDCILSFKKVRQLVNQPRCELTRVKFNDKITDPADMRVRVFERIDRTKPFTDDNLIVCTLLAQNMRKFLTVKEIGRTAKTVVGYRKKHKKCLI